MKSTFELEKKLEAQELLRIEMLELENDPAKRKALLDEISRINSMRDALQGKRLDSRNGWLKTLIQTGLPVVATMGLAVMGFACEQLNGNPTGFTLRWLFGRAPK